VDARPKLDGGGGPANRGPLSHKYHDFGLGTACYPKGSAYYPTALPIVGPHALPVRRRRTCQTWPTQLYHQKWPTQPKVPRKGDFCNREGTERTCVSRTCQKWPTQPKVPRFWPWLEPVLVHTSLGKGWGTWGVGTKEKGYLAYKTPPPRRTLQ
jgi:hypothetical protein